MKDLQQQVVTTKNAINKSRHRCLVASSFIVLTLFAPFVNAENSVIGKVVYVDGEGTVQKSITVQG